MAGTLPAKKRCSITIVFAVMLGLLVVSGSSCMSPASYSTSTAAQTLPTTQSKYQTYITPTSQAVQDTLYDILGASAHELSQTGFHDIRNWVAANIVYMPDEERWGEDYWQTSEETLFYLTGDCEDFSILLCSLLRAYGIGADQVFVALGDDGQGEGHAFVIEDWSQEGDWQRIEPQALTQSFSIGWLNSLRTNPDAGLDKYDITAAFSDLYYYDSNSGLFSWMDQQASVWTLTDLMAIMGDILNGFSRVVQYLIGFLSG